MDPRVGLSGCRRIVRALSLALGLFLGAGPQFIAGQPAHGASMPPAVFIRPPPVPITRVATDGGADLPPGAAVQRSLTQVDDGPQQAVQAQACLAAATLHLSFSLLPALEAGSGHNILFSPYSLTRALGLLQMGARGRTAEQLAEALHVPNTGPHLAYAYAAAQAALSAEAQKSRAHTQLVQADAVWGAPWVSPETPYLSAVAAGFDDAWHTVDFAETSSLARDTINAWVFAQTGGHIQNLLSQGAPSVHTHLLLINTLFVSAPWAKAFNPKYVHDAPFYNADASVSLVPTMLQEFKVPYARAHGFVAVDVAYRAADLSLTFVMPAPGSDVRLEALDAACLQALWAELTPQMLRLSLPKFKVEASFGVKDALMAVGVEDVFVPEQADLGGIDGHVAHLYVDEVVHKASLEVNEKGTLASAATGIALRTTALAEDPQIVCFERPFMFFMRDRKAGTILFAGKITHLDGPAAR